MGVMGEGLGYGLLMKSKRYFKLWKWDIGESISGLRLANDTWFCYVIGPGVLSQSIRVRGISGG
jgi:hypothetical protein